MKGIVLSATVLAAMVAGIFAAPQASADPFGSPAHQADMQAICNYLDTNPTVYGVDKVINDWLQHYGTSDASVQLGADTLMDAVTYDCPAYKGIVVQWTQLHHKTGVFA